jgi:hypothetical protein
MGQREVHIISYFSLPTDLAAAMRPWPEFVEGLEYSVTLRSDNGPVAVQLRDDDGTYVSVTGPAEGPLFERVLGVVIYELSRHSDNLMVDRVS